MRRSARPQLSEVASSNLRSGTLLSGDMARGKWATSPSPQEGQQAREKGRNVVFRGYAKTREEGVAAGLVEG